MNCPNCNAKLDEPRQSVHVSRMFGGEVRVSGHERQDDAYRSGFVVIIADDDHGKTSELYLDLEHARKTMNALRRAIRAADVDARRAERTRARERRRAQRDAEMLERLQALGLKDAEGNWTTKAKEETIFPYTD